MTRKELKKLYSKLEKAIQAFDKAQETAHYRRDYSSHVLGAQNIVQEIEREVSIAERERGEFWDNSIGDNGKQIGWIAI